MSSRETRARLRRTIVRAVVVLLIVEALAINWRVLSALPAPTSITGGDFIEYWTASKLLLEGGNPYSPDQMMSVQRELGWTQSLPRMMWNPPHTLSLVLPLALIRYPVANALWLELQVALVMMSSWQLWRLYCGPAKHAWVALVLPVVFVPTSVLVSQGQISGIILAALVGFVLASKNRRWLIAGAFLPLAAIKPQLLCVLWLVVALWTVRTRQWGILGGAIGVLLAMSLAPTLINPEIWLSYLEWASNDPVGIWITPTIGASLRLLLGWNQFWLQYVPPVAGAVGVSVWWHWNHQRWDWPEQMPLVLTVAMVATPYGWVQDQVVLLFVLIEALTWCFRTGVHRSTLEITASYVAIFLVSRVSAFPFPQYTSGTSFVVPNQSWNMWMATAYFLWYLYLKRVAGKVVATINNSELASKANASDLGNT